MDVFLYFTGRLPVGRDELEDALEEAFADRGEVTGAGSGVDGTNIDLEIDDSLLPNEIVATIRDSLATFDLAVPVYVVIDGQRSLIEP